jgi:hypothetical protein
MRTRTATKTATKTEPEDVTTSETQVAPKTRRKAPAKEEESSAAEAPPPIFATSSDQVMQIHGIKMPDMQHGFQTVVQDLFESGFDVAAEYAEIKEALVIKDALTPDRLRRAANAQEDIANRAHQLYIIAKVEVQAYMRETEGIYGAIREAAIMELEKAKANKERTKQITDADAKSEAARLYPDEWADICTRRDRAEAMLKQLENLAQLARSRCYTVSNMAHPGARLS